MVCLGSIGWRGEHSSHHSYHCTSCVVPRPTCSICCIVLERRVIYYCHYAVDIPAPSMQKSELYNLPYPHSLCQHRVVERRDGLLLVTDHLIVTVYQDTDCYFYIF